MGFCPYLPGFFNTSLFLTPSLSPLLQPQEPLGSRRQGEKLYTHPMIAVLFHLKGGAVTQGLSYWMGSGESPIRRAQSEEPNQKSPIRGTQSEEPNQRHPIEEPNQRRPSRGTQAEASSVEWRRGAAGFTVTFRKKDGAELRLSRCSFCGSPG
jgi:hypothetical protein